MTRFTRHTTQLAAALALGLLAALPLPQAVAQSAHEGHHPQTAPAAGTMDHGSMDHQQMMQQMHEQHMNQGQMEHGKMGHGQMNHGSMPPAQTAPATKDGKDGQ